MSERGPQDQPDEAMMDLLIKQVTDGLSPAEQRALDVLDSAVVSAHLRDFERAAAAIALAGSANAPPLPPELAQRVARQAQQHFAGAAGADDPIDIAAARSAAAIRAPAARQSSRKSLMLQKWMFGVSHHAYGRLSVRGMWPPKNSCNRIFQ